MNAFLVTWSALPLAFGIALLLVARPAMQMGGRWTHLRWAIPVATVIGILGPVLALVSVATAMTTVPEAAPDRRATLLAQNISEALNLGGFVFLIGLALQLTLLAVAIRGRRKARAAPAKGE